MFKYTRTTLEKLEDLFKEQEYTVRYEKGTFQSGYCLVENRQIIVVNKFFDTEGRINTLVEILGKVELDPSLMSERSQKFYKEYEKLQEDEA